MISPDLNFGAEDTRGSPLNCNPARAPGDCYRLIVHTTVGEFCESILSQGELPAKLVAPEAHLEDCIERPVSGWLTPTRTPELAPQSGGERLPRPGLLRSAAARAECLARFAHHELAAVELFAWAIMRWPELPAELRQGWLATLAEEQIHCSLYLDRLTAHGASLADFQLSDYFWKLGPAIDAAEDGPKAFLAAMGLTLEQANLDFTLTYRDAFREAGDEASARVCERVHEDEVRHVSLASHWLQELSPPGTTDLDAYQAHVPFPLGPARAKGRRCDRAARRAAGLSDALIERVRGARSNQEKGHPDAEG
jgi:uncharacterized ferritin-like protein (DUF455 family)